jgi:hypothetical protein
VVEQMLRQLTAVAWRDRLDPRVHALARELTDREASRQAKVGAIVDHLDRFWVGRSAEPTDAEHVTSASALLSGLTARSVDADDACLFVATLAMSVGVRCRFVAARYGQSWTCWVAYEVGDCWETVDPLRQRPEREPDERVTGPVPGEG